ncbi:MAG: complex I subunit 5 family protein [Wenzhouxiangella sp.]
MSLPAHGLALVILVPILGGALIAVLCRRAPIAAWVLSVGVCALTLVTSLALIRRLIVDGPFSYAAGGWPPPLGVALHFDIFGAVIAVFGAITLLVLFFSRRYIPAVIRAERIPLYYALVVINLGGMNGFLVTGDLFNLFVFMEVFSVSAYALVAMASGPRPALAAIKYLLLGAVSSLLVLFAIGLIFAQTGTLNMADAASRLDSAAPAAPAALALGALLIGFMVKAALFPLHVWLPDAHASAPGPVSALLSAVVVKAGVIGIIRVLQVFGDSGTLALTPVYSLMTWLGAIGALAGAVAALVQSDLKRLLAYSTVTNIGYIFMGLGLASATAASGAMVHLVNHAVTKAALFLAAGALIHQSGLRRIDDLRGLGQRMPLSALALGIALLAVAGVPPTAGFVGKWQIALGALQTGRPAFMLVIIVGGLLVLAYGVRIINVLFFRTARHDVVAAREAPLSMLVPVLLLAAGSFALGLAGKPMLDLVIPAIIPLTGAG